MSVEENKAIAQRWHEEVFNQRNFAAIDELLDPSYVNHTAHFQGRAAAKEQFTKLISDTPNLQLMTDDMIAEGDKVVMRWSLREGEQVTSTGITILRIADGKIVEDWFCASEMPAA